MSRTLRAAKGFVASIFQYLSQILLQVLLAPIVLKVAGRETLGAYSALMQVLAFISLTDFMGSWVMERFLGQSMGLDDGGERFRCIFTTVRTVILACDFLKAVLIFIFSLFVAHLFHLSPAVALEAKHALWVIAAGVLLKSPMAAYLNASVATQDMAAVYLIGTCAGVARSLASLAVVLAGSGLFGLMIVGTIVEGVGYIFYRFNFRKKNPTLMPSWGIPDKALLKEMAGFGAHTTVLNLGNALLLNTGNIVAGLTSGAAMTSTFYTSQVPTMTCYNMLIRLNDSTMPAINELWGRREVGRLQNALRRVTRLVLALTLPLATGVLVFNRDVVITWVGAQQYAGALLTASLAAFCAIAALQRIAVVYSYSFGWVRLLNATGLIQGAVNFGLAYFLARRLGLGGITLALAVVILPQTVILWRRTGKFLEIDLLPLLSGCFLRSLIPLAGATACGLLVHGLVVIGKHHFAALFAEIVPFLLAYALLAYPLVLSAQDRSQLRFYGRSILGRVFPPLAPGV
jgi:O-antigen/teichoic acid export membrane protein